MLGSTQVTQQFQVVSQSTLHDTVHVQPAAFFDANGTQLDFTGNPVAATTATAGIVKKATAITAIATADATDPASVITLANAIKVKFNALLAAQQVAGQVS